MDWKMLAKSNEGLVNYLKSVDVEDHPLKPNVVERIPIRILGSLPSTGKTTPIASTGIMLDLNAVLEGLDPLSKFSIAETDPLSQMATKDSNKPEVKNKDNLLDIEPWSSRKHAILSKYTTSERLCIVTSFMPDSDKVVVKTQSSVDKVQHRLEQLDCIEEGSQKKAYLSQIEYMAQIEQLNKELVLAWNTNQRVKALKIAIQCAKFLSDTDVLNFYPSKFVLVTDILDTFGNLVYERLHSKSDVTLPDNFAADMVPESTKETCRNWFYKIASIRELVPRIYMEMAILKSYRYLTCSDYSTTLLRLTKMIRGIGNPLVAAYARCYLCRVGLSVNTLNTNYLLENFYDFLEGYKHLIGKNIKHISKQNINISDYMALYIPALDFILQAAVHKRSDEMILDDLLQKCLKQSNYYMLLYIIMSSFKKIYVAQKCTEFLDAMEQEADDAFPKHLLLKKLGNCMSDTIPPNEHRKLILNAAWRQISALNDSGQYIVCADAWIQFTVKNFNCKEVNKVIRDIIMHMMPHAAYENHCNMLKLILEKIMFDMNDFEIVFSMENFLPFIDLFQQENLRIDVCKNILISCNTDQKTYDPVIINALMFLCNILHDSVNALTVDDERRQIGELISAVIRQVDYGRNFEQQLSFYVEARGAFTNLDIVLSQLVQCVNSLAVQTRQIVKGYHTRKTSAFVRACAAYCFITIPSIGSIKTRLELYLLSARVALFNNCLGQADACLKAAFPLIPEFCRQEERNYESYIISYICNFMSILLVVPDSPSSGVLTLTRSLLNTLQEIKWHKQETVIQLYLHVLDLLSAMAQENYPYHVDKVESNDNLYGLDAKFLKEIDKISTIILREILSYLKSVGPSAKQGHFALEIFTRVVMKSNIQDEEMKLLGKNLWNLNLKHGFADLKYMIKLKDLLKKYGETTRNNVIVNFVDSLKLSL